MQASLTTDTLDAFQAALDQADPILAGAFMNVHRQSPGKKGPWQYLWIPATQLERDGTLRNDEAMAVFNAHSQSVSDIPGSDHALKGLLAHHVSSNIAKPFQCLLDDFERDERRDVRDIAWSIDDHEESDEFEKSLLRNLDLLLQALRGDLDHAKHILQDALLSGDQDAYTHGIRQLDQVYHYAHM